jgi:hypothetical protein
MPWTSIPSPLTSERHPWAATTAAKMVIKLVTNVKHLPHGANLKIVVSHMVDIERNVRNSNLDQYGWQKELPHQIEMPDCLTGPRQYKEWTWRPLGPIFMISK